MAPKRTYINLINDFWTNYESAQEPISAPASMVYFYLLNRINRNRWQPVFISDHELADAINVSRRHLPGYKDEITAAGLISFEIVGKGRTAGSVYQLPTETAPKVTINGAKSNQSETETAPKVTINGAKRSQLTPPTPIISISKTNKDHNIYNEDVKGAAVEVEEVEFFEVEKIEPSADDKKPVEMIPATPAVLTDPDAIAAQMEALREKAKNQGAALLKFFFSQSYTVDVQCMQNGVTPEQYQALANEVINDWIQAGTVHDDFKGNFDHKEAARHLQNTIRKKAAALRSGTKTRQQTRQDLMAGALRDLAQAAQNPTTTAAHDDELF